MIYSFQTSVHGRNQMGILSAWRDRCGFRKQALRTSKDMCLGKHRGTAIGNRETQPSDRRGCTLPVQGQIVQTDWA